MSCASNLRSVGFDLEKTTTQAFKNIGDYVGQQLQQHLHLIFSIRHVMESFVSISFVSKVSRGETHFLILSSISAATFGLPELRWKLALA